MANQIKYDKVWTFKSKNIASNFDQHVRQSVPLYDEIQRMVLELSQYFLRDNDTFLDLGMSTGTTIKNISKNSFRKNLRFIGIDDSQEMIDIAKTNLSKIKNVELLHTNLNEGLTNFKTKGPVSVVVSLFTMQFINIEKRENLLRQIFQTLRKNGVLIIIEKILGNNAHFNEIMIDLYHDMKIRNGLSPEDNQKKSQSLRGIMAPISVDDNLAMLRRCRFSDVDIFFKWYNFVGIIVVK